MTLADGHLTSIFRLKDVLPNVINIYVRIKESVHKFRFYTMNDMWDDDHKNCKS